MTIRSRRSCCRSCCFDCVQPLQPEAKTKLQLQPAYDLSWIQPSSIWRRLQPTSVSWVQQALLPAALWHPSHETFPFESLQHPPQLRDAHQPLCQFQPAVVPIKTKPTPRGNSGSQPSTNQESSWHFTWSGVPPKQWPSSCIWLVPGPRQKHLLQCSHWGSRTSCRCCYS